MSSPGWQRSPAKTPHFFKIIHTSILRDGKLGFPKRFTRKYGKNLSNFVSLKVPSGEVWRVELMKGDGEVWLQDGWQEFAGYYSIGYGHFIVFRYEGNSNFHVIIFDASASEIDYPCINTTHDELCKMEEVEINISAGEEGLNQTKKKKSNPCLQPTKRRRSIPPITANTCGATRVKVEKSDGQNFHAREGCGGVTATKNCTLFGVRPPMTATKEVWAPEMAKAFQSQNPFFISNIRPSYNTHGLNVPVKFINRYLRIGGKKNNITLWVSEGRTWCVGCRVGRRSAELYAGWKIFVQDNGLKVGDVCAFELIKCTGISMKVTIFRNNRTALAICDQKK